MVLGRGERIDIEDRASERFERSTVRQACPVVVSRDVVVKSRASEGLRAARALP